MKKSPEMQKLEEMLHSGKIVAGGFMGEEVVDVTDVIDRDMALLSQTGHKVHEVAEKMRQITAKAISGLGTWVDIDEHLRARCDEVRGWVICPWPHPARFDKRVTEVFNKTKDKKIMWSDLSIHLIEEHGFFEGRGSVFRIEPQHLLDTIFV